MIGLLPHETALTGQWILVDGKVRGDEICARIDHLTNTLLIEIAHDASGWLRLYRDPQDSRLWELRRPQSERHGGGPPQLVCISAERAKKVYDYSP